MHRVRNIRARPLASTCIRRGIRATQLKASRLAVALLVVCSSGATPGAAPAQDRAATLDGRVVDMASGQGVSSAVVMVGSARATTDASGRFRFAEIAPGEHRVQASASGYFSGSYAQSHPRSSGRPVLATAGQHSDIVIPLWRHASIRGVVVGDDGVPVPGATVIVSTAAMWSSQRIVLWPHTEGIRRTDDRGVFEFDELHAGEYFVSVPFTAVNVPASTIAGAQAAGPAPAASVDRDAVASMTDRLATLTRLLDLPGTLRQESDMLVASVQPHAVATPRARQRYATQFFPDAGSPEEAAAITLRLGERRSGVDVRLRRVEAQRVSGRVIADGGNVAGAPVLLIPAYAAQAEFERRHVTAATITGPDGRFEFAAVPAGSYVARSSQRTDPLAGAGRPARWGEVRVEVGASPVVIGDVFLEPAGAISGTLQFDGSAPRPTALQLVRILERALEPPASALDLSRPAVAVDVETGAFSVSNLPPGRYFRQPFTLLAAVRWHVEAVSLAGQSLLDVPLTLGAGEHSRDVRIRLTDRPANLEGTARDARGTPLRAGIVVLMPADTDRWARSGANRLGFRFSDIDAAGRYSIPAAPSGTFRLAVTSFDGAAELTTTEIAQLAASADVVELRAGVALHRDVVGR